MEILIVYLFVENNFLDIFLKILFVEKVYNLYGNGNRAFRRISLILAALLRYRFWLVRKDDIQWLLEPRSKIASDTGSFFKFESVGSLGCSFDYRGRIPRPSPSWWSADATPGVTDTTLEC